MNKDNLFWNENSNEIPIESLKRDDAPEVSVDVHKGEETVPQIELISEVTENIENAEVQTTSESETVVPKDQTDEEIAAAIDSASSSDSEEPCERPTAVAAEPDDAAPAEEETATASQNQTEQPYGQPMYGQPAVANGYQGGQYGYQVPYTGYGYDNIPMVEQYDKRAARKRFTILGFGFAIFSFVMYGAVMLMELIAMAIEGIYGVHVLDSNLFLNAVTPAAMYLFALPVMIAFFAILRVKGERPPEKRKLPFSMWVVIIVICFGLMYIGAFMGNFVMDTVSEVFEYNYGNALDEVVDYNSLWISGIFVCIVAPIGEEFVFRKIVIDRTHKYGAVVSVVLSALMFGLMHGNFYQFFYAFLIGLVFGYIYYSTGKIWYTIVLHSIVNFVGSIVTTLLAGASEKMLEALEPIEGGNFETLPDFLLNHGWAFVAELAFSLFVFAAMICAVVVPLVMRKKMFPKREGTPVPVKASFAAAFANPGVIVMLVVYVLEFAMFIFLPILVNYLNAIAQEPMV